MRAVAAPIAPRSPDAIWSLPSDPTNHQAKGLQLGRHTVMLASWYVALKHDFPTKMPAELKQGRERILFARWLVMTGRLSDFGPLPEMPRRSDPVALFGWRSEPDESLSEAA